MFQDHIKMAELRKTTTNTTKELLLTPPKRFKTKKGFAQFQNYDYQYSKYASLYNGYFGGYTFCILRLFLKLLEWTGHGVPWIIFAIWATVSRSTQEEKKPYVDLMFGLIIDLIVIASMKLTFKRARPIYNEGDLPLSASRIDGFSFPSGHATRAVMLLVVYYSYQDIGPIDQFYINLWVVGLCYSRVALGRHFITDVLVGGFVGFLEGLFVMYFPVQPMIEIVFSCFKETLYA